MKMKNTNSQKPRIFELWDEIFGSETQENETEKQGGKKRNDGQ